MIPNWKNGLIYIAILLAGIIIFTFIFSAPQKPTEIPLDEAITMSQNKEISKLVLDGDTLLITATDGRELKAPIGNMTYVDLKELGLNLANIDYSVKQSSIDWGGMLIGFLPFLALSGFLFYILFRARGVNN